MRGMGPAPRNIHRWFAPWLVLPLVISLATGIFYRLGKAWFQLDIDLGDRILEVHSGSWLGSPGSLFYVLFAGLGLLALVVTGSLLLFKSRAQKGIRITHRIFGFVLFLPLAASATTGVAYKIGEEWLGFSDDVLKWLMVVHEGAWMGKALRPWYVLFVGIGLLVLLVSGLRLSGLFRRIRWN